MFQKLTHIQYIFLLNDKEFCFSLIGINSIFSNLPRSEYNSREVYSGLCLFLSIVYSVFQRCPTRDEISFPVGQSNCKKGQNFQKFQNFTKFQKFHIEFQNFQKKFKIIKLENIFFLKVQNFQKIS